LDVFGVNGSIPDKLAFCPRGLFQSSLTVGAAIYAYISCVGGQRKLCEKTKDAPSSDYVKYLSDLSPVQKELEVPRLPTHYTT